MDLSVWRYLPHDVSDMASHYDHLYLQLLYVLSPRLTDAGAASLSAGLNQDAIRFIRSLTVKNRWGEGDQFGVTRMIESLDG